MRVPKTAELVAAQIRRRIVMGELKEGDFLPPEGQLIQSLSISRPTLREAFRILEAENFISVVRGSRTGACVHAPRVEAASRYAGFVLQSQGTRVADVYEARLAIEPYAAAQLAERRPEGAVERLLSEIARLEQDVEDEKFVSFMIGIAGFHRLLVELGGNKTLLFMIDMLQDVVAQYQVRFLTRHPIPIEEQRRRGLAGLRSFKRLVDYIEAGDAARAESHWRLHLANSNTAWVPIADRGRMVDVFDT